MGLFYFVILMLTILFGGFLEIWIRYKKDIKHMNKEFVREAIRINNL